MNTLKTTLLLGLLTGLILAVGQLLGGNSGMVVALVLAAGMNFFSYWFSDKIVLAMYRAQPIAREQAPELYETVERLVARRNMPLPRIYLLPQDSPNAFATGRNPKHAAVAVTEGLLKLMDREELEGVLAHELSHVTNRDILIGSVAATIAGAISMIAQMAHWAFLFGGFGGRDDRGRNPLAALVTIIVAPIAALLIQMAVSRSREFQADRSGAELTGNPYGLARALEKLGQASKRIPMEANPATSHLFIVAPFNGQALMSLFSTHPPLEERIRRLLGRPNAG
jgi:heat shock protein HtpX